MTKIEAEKEKVFLVREGNLISEQMAIDAKYEDDIIQVFDVHIAYSQTKMTNATLQA